MSGLSDMQLKVEMATNLYAETSRRMQYYGLPYKNGVEQYWVVGVRYYDFKVIWVFTR